MTWTKELIIALKNAVDTTDLTVTCHSPHVRESKTVLDSGFHTINSGSFNLSVELGFRFPNVNEWNPDSLSCILVSKAQDSWIPQEKKFLDSGFHKQKFPGIGIPFTRQIYSNISSFLPSLIALIQKCSYYSVHKAMQRFFQYIEGMSGKKQSPSDFR